MKLENLSKEWQDQLHLSTDEHDITMAKLQKNEGYSDAKIKEMYETRKRESVAFLFLVGRENRALNNSLEDAGDSLSGDEKYLIAILYARLYHSKLLPHHIDKRTNLLPILQALIKTYDTCEEFDASVAKLKPLIKAYTKSEQLQKPEHAEKLLLSILKNLAKDNINDYCDFIRFIDVANEIFLSEKAIDNLCKLIIEKNINIAHLWLSDLYRLKCKMKVDGKYTDENFVNELEKMLKQSTQDQASITTLASSEHLQLTRTLSKSDQQIEILEPMLTRKSLTASQ